MDAAVLHARRIGSGPRAVLAHGFTQTSKSWLHIAGTLARDHEIVMVDLPGHGGSAHLCESMPGVARLLGKTGGRASYCGYSMGARAALRLAIDEPDLVERLALVSVNPGIEDESARSIRRKGDQDLAANLEVGGREGLPAFMERWLAQPILAGLPRDVALFEDRVLQDPDALAASLRTAGLGATEPMWDRLAELAMPVLVVSGENDDRYVGIARRIVDRIGSNAQFAMVSRAGHAAHLERPDDVAALLAEFFGGEPHAGEPHAGEPHAGEPHVPQRRAGAPQDPGHHRGALHDSTAPAETSTE